MRAVNLIPADGSGLGAAPGRSVGVYVLLAALVVAVVMAGSWAAVGKQVSDRRGELAQVQAQAAAAQAQAATLAPYRRFAQLSKARVTTISQIAASRFDWAHALRELARVIPAHAELVSLTASTTPTSSAGAGAGVSALRSALPAPAFDITGCTTSQAEVARLMARLRAVDGVTHVSLATSEKADSAAASPTDCRADDHQPQFQMTVFFRGVPALPAQTPAPAAAPSAVATGAEAPR